MSKASMNDAQPHYLDLGERSAIPIILIHGFPFSHEMWEPQIEALKDNFRVVAYDIRGLGKSDVGDGQYTLEMFVDDLITLMDHLGLKRAVWCGLSMGGYIALRAMERNPERCCGLVLCDTTSIADSDEAKLRRASAIKTVKREGIKTYAAGVVKSLFATQTFVRRPIAVDITRRIVEANSPIGICGALLAMAARTDTTASLKRISVPTLILVGELDTITPPALAEQIHELIPESVLHLIPDAAHLSNLENSEEFNRLLLSFLRNLKWASAQRR
jgi:3-oxoadipate enol-lactonase